MNLMSLKMFCQEWYVIGHILSLSHLLYENVEVFKKNTFILEPGINVLLGIRYTIIIVKNLKIIDIWYLTFISV